MTTRSLILGAKSVIAQALSTQLAREGSDLTLAARQSNELRPFVSDLQLHTRRQIDLVEFDALSAPCKTEDELRARFGDFDLAILVFGYLGQHGHAIRDFAEQDRILRTNFLSATQILSLIANYLYSNNKRGGIIGITSVAGDRGRQSNYIYGAAKGGLSIYLQGLRNRLAGVGIHVMTVKPGFVDTPMTEDIEGLFLVASPQRVARDILIGYAKKRDVVYTPWFWRFIMLVIKTIPERIFKRLQL